MASRGYSLPFTLVAADMVGKFESSYTDRVPMDPVYRDIPRTNVDNIIQGFNDARSGTLCNPY